MLTVDSLLLLIVDPLCWLMIPPRINTQQCWLSIVSYCWLLTLSVNCWSLIHPWSTVNSVACQPSLLTVDHWSTPDEQSTVLIINWFTVDCWPSLLTIDLPLMNRWQCWLSIGSLLIVNPHCWLFPPPPKDQQWTVLIVDHHTIDCWPSLLTINCQCTPPVNRPHPLPKTWDEVGVQKLWFEV